MKIISWNVNGLRAVHKKPSIAPVFAKASAGKKAKEGKDFLGWLKKSGADIVCLQEIKASMDKVPTELINPAGYVSFYNPAQKPGYSGTAVFAKVQPKRVINKMGLKEFDEQGRFLRLDFDNFTLINLYLPHGGRDKSSLRFKMKAYKYFFEYLNNPTLTLPFKRGGREILLVGDFNIAHEEIDLARPRENKNNIMFTAKERAQIDKLIEMGFVDTFRQLHPTEQKYTWWPYFANARERDLGWRIDYAFASKNLAPKIKKAEIMTGIKGSDHCPIGVEF